MVRVREKTETKGKAVDNSKNESLTRPSGEDRSRGRPGRRSARERTEAVLELLQGKASVDQIARRFGVLPKTVEGWRDDALSGIEGAMRRGDGPSERERELEKENGALRNALTDATIQVSLLQREMGIKVGPTRPRRSQR